MSDLFVVHPQIVFGYKEQGLNLKVGQVYDVGGALRCRNRESDDSINSVRFSD